MGANVSSPWCCATRRADRIQKDFHHVVVITGVVDAKLKVHVLAWKQASNERTTSNRQTNYQQYERLCILHTTPMQIDYVPDLKGVPEGTD